MGSGSKQAWALLALDILRHLGKPELSRVIFMWPSTMLKLFDSPPVGKRSKLKGFFPFPQFLYFPLSLLLSREEGHLQWAAEMWSWSCVLCWEGALGTDSERQTSDTLPTLREAHSFPSVRPGSLHCFQISV